MRATLRFYWSIASRVDTNYWALWTESQILTPYPVFHVPAHVLGVEMDSKFFAATSMGSVCMARKLEWKLKPTPFFSSFENSWSQSCNLDFWTSCKCLRHTGPPKVIPVDINKCTGWRNLWWQKDNMGFKFSRGEVRSREWAVAIYHLSITKKIIILKSVSACSCTQQGKTTSMW